MWDAASAGLGVDPFPRHADHCRDVFGEEERAFRGAIRELSLRYAPLIAVGARRAARQQEAWRRL